MPSKRSRRISTLGSQLTSMVSVTLVMLLIASAALAGVGARRLDRSLRHNFGFVVKMEREAPDKHVNYVKTALLRHKGVESFVYSGADQILQDESELLGEDIAGMLGANPYSAEFEVKLAAPYSSADSLESIAARVRQIPGVDEIIADAQVIEGADSGLRRIGLVLGGLGALLAVVAVALINNTVSLSIYSRRFVIHAMKLVGATSGFICRPFLLAGARTGVVAAAVSCVAIVGGRAYLGGMDAWVNEILPWSSVATVAALCAVGGVGLCMLTAWCAARRYLKASYDEMFLK